MAIGGRKPTDDGVPKLNRNATLEWTEVVNTPNDDYPPLPEYRGLADEEKRDRRFRKSTRKYYMNIAKLPHTVLWGDSEWEFLAFTCEIREAYYDDPKKSSSYETALRAREKQMGTTADYRRDLRIKYVPVPEESSDDVREVDDLDRYSDL